MATFNDLFNVRSRMREVFIGTIFILVVAAVGNYFLLSTITIPLILLVTAVLNLIPLKLLGTDKIDPASGFYLTVTFTGVTAMIWLNEGLRDSAIFAYPALMTYASMLGTQRQFYLTTIFMTGSIILLGVVNLTGTLTHVTGPLGAADQ